MITKYLLALAALLLANVCRAEESVLLAVVNGDSITSDDVLHELMNIHSQQEEEVSRPDYDINRLVQSLINDRLIVQDALALGMDQETRTLETVKWFRETMAFQLLLQDIAPNDDVTDEEIRATFEKLYRRVQSRLICVADSNLAAQLADSVRMGISMASLATRHAVDRYKDFGGDAGTHPLYDLSDDITDKFEQNPIGTVIGPMQLWGVWLIARAENFLPPDQALYDSVKSLVKRQILLDRGAALRRDLIAKNGANIPLQIDSTALESILEKAKANETASDKPVVTVGNSRYLTQEELRKKFAHRAAMRSDRDNRLVLNEVLDEQVQTMMLKEIAKRTDYVSDPRLDEDATAFRDSILVLDYLETVIAPTVKVSDDEVSAYFDHNKESFRTPGRVRIATITRTTPDEAQADYEKIIAGADFGWIAEKHSIDNFAQSGGLRDWVSLEMFPQYMASQLDTMQMGSCMSPVQGDEGFLVIKVVEREEGKLLTLDQATQSIKSMIEQKKQFEAIDQTIRELRQESDIYVNQEALNAFHPLETGE